MDNFYHQASRKPRVLGLTACPLINVKSVSDDHLRKELGELERRLEARVVAMKELGLDYSGDHLLNKEAAEHAVTFRRKEACSRPISPPQMG